MKNLYSSLRMFGLMTILTGVIYPLVVTGIAQLTMSAKANGDILKIKSRVIGATLIGQRFEDDKYFQGRPSAIDYNPLPSGGSNLGPTSNTLKKLVEQRKSVIVKANDLKAHDLIPPELLFASGSGLDPHITPKAAYFQIKRIIKARGLDEKNGEETLKELIQSLTEDRMLGFIGESHVNVLKLNLALDGLIKDNKDTNKRP